MSAARDQLAGADATEISMRRIAGAIGLTSSAVRYYFPTRQAIVEALIVDGYRSLEGVLQFAYTRALGRPPREQWISVCAAHRLWALAYPSTYSLLYGRGEAAARKPEIHDARSRVVEVLFAVVRAAASAKQIDTLRIAGSVPDSFRVQLADWRHANDSLKSLAHGALTACMIIFAQLHGAITLEIIGQLPSQLKDHATLFEVEMAHGFDAIGPATHPS